MDEIETEQAPVEVGDILADKYRVERVLGIGGMGAVVAARHTDLGELRALKFMLPKVSANADAVRRFMREARAVARLKSQFVAKIYDIGRLEGGEPYMVMEYLEGQDLKALLARDGPLPIDVAVDYTMQMLAGLAEAHAYGIIHRDLKPPNLFVTKGADGLPAVKILDFGVSKLIGDQAAQDMTTTETMLGSPHYMSPEQMECTRDVDFRTDIWSLGVLLYEMLTGEVPFDAPAITALSLAVVRDEPERPCSHRSDVPSELEAVVLRCLEKIASDRYRTVTELAEELGVFGSEKSRALIGHIGRIHDASTPGFVLTSDAGEAAELADSDEADEAADSDEADEAADSDEAAARLDTGDEKATRKLVTPFSRPKNAAPRDEPADSVQNRPTAREIGSRTAASWHTESRAADGRSLPPSLKWALAGGAVVAALAIIIAAVVGDSSETPSAAVPDPVASVAVSAEDSAQPSASAAASATAAATSATTAEPTASASASASASAKAKKKTPKKKRQHRRVDIYDGLDDQDDPYEDGLPPPRRKSVRDRYDFVPDEL